MNAVRVIGWLIALAVAIYVGLFSYVIANEVRAPATVHALGLPATGLVRANFAIKSYAVRKMREPDARVNDPERELAKQGYRKEALSVSALSMIAESMTQPSSRDGRQRLLELAGELTRRNSFVGRELLTAAAYRKDEATFFLWLSRMVATDTDMREAYVTAMAQATVRPGAVEALTPIIGKSPGWADFYWRKLVRQPASLENGARLRIAVARAPWNQTGVSENDRDLSMALANRGSFDVADDLAATLVPRSAHRDRQSNMLVNADFSRQPTLPPFDWQLTAAGNMGASVDDKARHLAISAIAGARGAAARQLTQLRPGAYSLGWSLSNAAPLPPDALFLNIRCAERGAEAEPGASLALTSGKQRREIVIPDDPCRWYWFSIDTRVADDSPGIDVILSGLSLAPLAAGES